MTTKNENPIRWSATVNLENKSFISANFGKNGVFECSDIKVYTRVTSNIQLEEFTNPLGVLPPRFTLKVDVNNPASIASSFYYATLDIYRDSSPKFTFSGSNYLLPGTQLEEDSSIEKFATDQSPIEDITGKISKLLSSGFILKYNENEERDSHGRWTSGGEGGEKENSKAIAEKTFAEVTAKDNAIRDQFIGNSTSEIFSKEFERVKDITVGKFTTANELSKKIGALPIKGLKTYTGQFHKIINDYLRTGNVPSYTTQSDISEAKSAIFNVTNGFVRAPATKEDLLVFRDIAYTGQKRAKEVVFTDPSGRAINLTDLQIGQVISDKGFMSTTINPSNSTFSGNDVSISTLGLEIPITPDSYVAGCMVITVPEGSKALYLNDISAFKAEHEVLLNRDSKLLITGIEKVKLNGTQRIQLQVHATLVSDSVARQLSGLPTHPTDTTTSKPVSTPQPIETPKPTGFKDIRTIKMYGEGANVIFGKHGEVKIVSIKDDKNPNYVKVSGIKISDGSKVTFPASVSKKYAYVSKQ